MGTYIAIPVDGITTKSLNPTKTYALDLDKGRIIGVVDGRKAIEQFIRKALITPRFKCLIYDNQYGSEIKQLITTDDASQSYIAAELPRMIKDAIIHDSRITDVDTSAFEIRFDGDCVYADFEVETIYGTLNFEEVIDIV